MSTYTTAANYEREQPEPLSTEQKIQSYADLHCLTFKEAVDDLLQINLDHFAQDEVPFLDDLSDLSIHDPSIGPGGSVSGLDKWLEENRQECHGSEIVSTVDLREFMKGKVLVGESAIKFALEEINLSIGAGRFRSETCKPNSPMQNERLARMELLRSVLQQALQHPTSSGKANE